MTRSFRSVSDRVSRVQSQLFNAELDPTFLAKAIEVSPRLDSRWAYWLKYEADPISKDDQKSALSNFKEHIPFIRDFLDSDCAICSNKDDYRKNPLRFFNQSLVNTFLWRKKTSGTSGRPLDVIYDNTFHFEQLFQSIRRVLHRAKRQGNRATHDLVSVAALHDNAQAKDHIWPDPTDDFRCIVQLYISASDPAQNEAVLDILKTLRPETVTLKPSILDRLRRHGHLQDLPCCHIVCSGSHLSRNLKEKAQLQTSATIIEAYGLTETALFASECNMGNGLHIDGDIRAEILDENGEALDGGSGRLVITTARNAAMPLMRYETGDIAEICSQRCPCGRPTPRIVKLIGRQMKNFILSCGKEASPSNLHTVFTHFPIEEIQFIQEAPDRLCVRLQERETIDDSRLTEFICAALGANIQIDIDRTIFPDHANDKFQRFIRNF